MSFLCLYRNGLCRRRSAPWAQTRLDRHQSGHFNHPPMTKSLEVPLYSASRQMVRWGWSGGGQKRVEEHCNRRSRHLSRSSNCPWGCDRRIARLTPWEMSRADSSYSVTRNILRWLKPSCFRVMTIQRHHVRGSPYGKHSMAPRASSQRRSSYTHCCQWKGMLTGVWQALFMAAGSTCIAICRPSIHGSARWAQVRKVDEAYPSRSQAFIFALFWRLQGNSSSEGRGGATSWCRLKHVALWAMVGTGQPTLRTRLALISGEAQEA